MNPVPEMPDLVLTPKPSRLAKYVGGHIDRVNYHQVNHVIAGFLGNQEILLASFDDGEIVAYYMRDIAHFVASGNTPGRPRPPIPKQFLHENVGASAWGLAIHSKSRVIAVSSNQHEITVFALALTQLPRSASGTTKSGTEVGERSVLKRKRKWTIVINLGEGAGNIPNITMLDDKDGFAEKVCAIDLYGTCWIADIWKSGTAPLKILHHGAPSANMEAAGDLQW